MKFVRACNQQVSMARSALARRSSSASSARAPSLLLLRRRPQQQHLSTLPPAKNNRNERAEGHCATVNDDPPQRDIATEPQQPEELDASQFGYRVCAPLGTINIGEATHWDESSASNDALYDHYASLDDAFSLYYERASKTLFNPEDEVVPT